MLNKFKITFVIAALSLLAGCHDGIREDKMMMMQEAIDVAREAERKAQAANALASEANFAAQKAQETADSALQCCNNNSTKIDRMFEKTMMK